MPTRPAAKTKKPRTDTEKILAALGRPHARLRFNDLAAAAGMSKRQLEACLPLARLTRPDLMYGKFDKTYWLANTPTWYSNQTDLSATMPVEGSFGVVSDTHLCSIAERLDVVEAAYTEFTRMGIKTVIHCGDLTDGWREYKHHVNFVKVHGDQEQAKYAIEKYPRRPGMTTYLIGGNHDDSYGASKIDRVSLVAHGFTHQGRDVKGRTDIKYLGQYSHYLIFPQEVRMHLLHPRGLNAYSYSYRQQKRAEAFPKNERPDVQFSGHYHTYCHTVHDGTHMVAAPGLQDETEYCKRLGFARSIGFMVVDYAIAKGKLTYLAPRVFMV